MRRTSATGSETGFTLLELLVVMAILVMMASLFPLALDRVLPARRVATATERIAAAVREAQASSVLSGTAKSVDLRLQKLPASLHVTLTDQDGRPLESLMMFPDGSAEAGRFEVREGAHYSAVRVSAITGRASLELER